MQKTQILTPEISKQQNQLRATWTDVPALLIPYEFKQQTAEEVKKKAQVNPPCLS